MTNRATGKQSTLGFDPQSQPVMPHQPLPRLPQQCLDLGYIRKAFNMPVQWRVDPLFADAFTSDLKIHPHIREAAVLIPFVKRETGINVVLTRRSEHLNDHAGQISFPGGCIELSDTDATAAAIRETYEEIGVEDKFVQVYGKQPALLTTTDFLMTPIIGELLPGFSIRPDESEVAEVFEVPLAVLMNPELHKIHQLQTPAGVGRYYLSISWQSYFIWGATAVLIRNFYHFLAASFSANIRS